MDNNKKEMKNSESKDFNDWFDSLSKEEQEEYWSEYQADIFGE